MYIIIKTNANNAHFLCVEQLTGASGEQMEHSSGYRACPVMLLERANIQPVVSDWREAVVHGQKAVILLLMENLLTFLNKDSRIITQGPEISSTKSTFPNAHDNVIVISKECSLGWYQFVDMM